MEFKSHSEHKVDIVQFCLGWTGSRKGRRKGSAKLEKVFSFSPRRFERGKKNLSWKGVVEGRLKGAILFAVSK
jgi:hypothetical protein